MRLLTALVLAICITAPAAPQDQPVPYYQATASNSHVYFIYANDLWRVPRSGGEPERLTSDKAIELRVIVSPDGSQLAFTREIGGKYDIYIMPSAGGEARRLTWHPKYDNVVAWSPDGESILFESNRTGDRPYRLWTMAVDGVHPEPVDLPYATWGSFNADATMLAYSPWDLPPKFRNYRGGATSEIRVVDLAAGDEWIIPGENSNDYYSHWHGNTIYFISDADGTYNLHKYDLKERQRTQLTHFKKWNIESGTGGTGCYTFIQNGSLWVYDYATTEVSKIPVEFPSDTFNLEPAQRNAARNLRTFQLAPDGAKAVAEARGDIFVIDLSSGEHENLTATSDVHERRPSWSPDGSTIAWFSDHSGYYQLCLHDVESGKTTRHDATGEPSFYWQATWSPDSRKLAFYDASFALWLFDIDRGRSEKIADAVSPYQEEYWPAFSPDSQWLAYCHRGENNLLAVHLRNLESGETAVVSNPMRNSSMPVFDSNGLYLYYLEENEFGAPRQALGSASYLYRGDAKQIVAVTVLQAEAPAPVMPSERSFQQLDSAFTVDLEGISERRFILNMEEADYGSIRAAGPGSLYLTQSIETEGYAGASGTNLYRLTLSLPRPEVDRIVEKIGPFELAGERVVFFHDNGLAWAPLTGEQTGEIQPTVAKELPVTVDRRAEWRQMLREALRIQQHYFYRANLHGQDLGQLEEHYLPFLETATDRITVGTIMDKMLSHMSISHMNATEGEGEDSGSSERIAVLGADFRPEGGRYRIEKIYRGDNSRFLLISPLGMPGVDVKEGDYLIAIDGEDVSTERNLYSYLHIKGPRPMEITVSADPEGSNPRTSMVMPSPGTNTLRHLSWVEENRRRVAEASNGRLAYIYIPHFGFSGIKMFIEQLWAQIDREGVIIDQRFSPGGSPGDFHIETLLRKTLSGYTFRHGSDQRFPSGILQGPRVLLINEWNASSTDTFPAMFRSAGLGTMVGKTTMGAGIGGWHQLPVLIDGARVNAPNRAYFEDGDWAIENIGIAPDVEVDLDLLKWRNGIDTQLEAAINIAMEQLEGYQPVKMSPPAAPVYK